MQYRLWGLMRKPVRLRWELKEVEDWDLCRPGGSALDVAFVRSLECEVAVRNGQHAGAILWDFEKFFDSVHLPALVTNATSLCFPLIDLVLGLQMHNTPRRLQVVGCCSRLIQRVRSILPGCARAISFTKALFKHLLPSWHGKILRSTRPSMLMILVSRPLATCSMLPTRWPRRRFALCSLRPSCL